MKIIASLFIVLCFPFLLFAQESKKEVNGFGLKAPNDPLPFANTIKEADLKNILSVLASDDFEGRETGTPGNVKAAHFIADKLKSFGIPPVEKMGGYFQKMAFTAESWNDVTLKVSDNPYRHLWDFYAFPTLNSHQEETTIDKVVFLGYGIDDAKYSDYKGKNLKGKTILIYDGEPQKKGISYLTKSKEMSDWTTDRQKKLRTAFKHGVKTVLIIDGNIKKNLSEFRRELLDGRMKMGEGEKPAENFSNNIYISSDIAKAIIGKKYKKVIKARKKIEKKGKSRSLKLATSLNLKLDKKLKQLIGDNVLGFIEGTDPLLKEEIVVVSAHYDHLGKRGNDIYNGADDNGSGSTAVLEIAQAFSEAKKQGIGPRRSVLTIWVTGEEKGLLGSDFYSENPIFPLEKTVADVNVDMIGRVSEKYEGNPNYIYVIGADRLSTSLHHINEAANKKYSNILLDYTYNDENDPNRFYYRSDHYNFAKKGIPSIFYFSGTHKDYHRTSDTVDKINFTKMEKIGRLIFHTAWELANREERIEVDVK